MELKKLLSLSVVTCALLMGYSQAQANLSDYLPDMTNTFDTIQPNIPGCGFDGLYLGGGVGAQYGDNTYNSSSAIFVPVATPLPFLNNQINASTGGFNFEGRAFLGYGYVFNRFYLGGEVGGDFGGFDKTFTHGAALGAPAISILNKAKLQTNSDVFTMDLLPGVLLTHSTLAYFRIGTEPNTLKLTDNTNSTFVGIGVPLIVNNINTSNSISRWPVRLGVGLQQHITQRIDVRGDLIFEDFGSISTQGASIVPNVGTPVFTASSNHAKLWTSQALVSAVIHL